MSARKSVNSLFRVGKSRAWAKWKNGALLSLNMARKPFVLLPVKMVFICRWCMSSPVRKLRIRCSLSGLRASSCTSSSSRRLGRLSSAIAPMIWLGRVGVASRSVCRSMPMPITSSLVMALMAVFALSAVLMVRANWFNAWIKSAAPPSMNEK